MKFLVIVESTDSSGAVVSSRRAELTVAEQDVIGLGVSIANFAKDVSIVCLQDTIDFIADDKEKREETAAGFEPVQASVQWTGEAKGHSKYGYQ